MAAPSWVVARPIAHRGLHDKSRGIIENSVSAARAAMAKDFAIECDVQLTADGEAVVFHDFTLDRLTAETGHVAAYSAGTLGGFALKGSTDTIPTLPQFLGVLGGKVPLVLEVKSAFDGDLRLTRRVAEVLKSYDGPVAVKSFDPDIVAALAGLTDRPRGIVAEAEYASGDMARLPAEKKRELSNLLHFERSKPDFISWRVSHLPHAAPYLCRTIGHLPVMAWTVRDAVARKAAETHADQMVFEGFVP